RERGQRWIGGEDLDGGVGGGRRRHRLRRRNTWGRKQPDVRPNSGKMRLLLGLIAVAEKQTKPARAHQPRSRLPCESRARPDIVVISIYNRPGITVLAGQGVLAVSDVEQATQIAGVYRLGEQLISQSQIERQFPGDPPVVLRKPTKVDAALA